MITWFLTAIATLIVPTAMYFLALEMSQVSTDSVLQKIIIGSLYIIVGFVLAILLFENSFFKNKILFNIPIIIVGGVIFFVATKSFIALLFIFACVFSFLFWNGKYNKQKE